MLTIYELAQVVRQAINAGAGILVFANQLVATPQDPQEIVELIYQDVKMGKISEQRIIQSYQRIKQLKQRLSNPTNQ